MSAERVIETARGELGSTESPPGSNRTKYGEAFGWDGVPWCVIFLWWCFREAGESAAFFGGAKTASCGTLLAWYREQGQVVPASEVQPGDIVILNFRGTKETQHCGLVVDVSPVVCPATGAPSYIITVEGNTSPGMEGSQDNGGCVALKQRAYRQILAVCRPTYKEEEEKPVNDWEKHWAAQHIQWAYDEGIAQGYQDGSFQPDKPVTRAELVTMLHRYDATLRQDIARMMEEFRR